MGMLRKPWMSESMGDKTRVSGTDSIEESDNVWEITDTAETGQSNQAGILEKKFIKQIIMIKSPVFGEGH